MENPYDPSGTAAAGGLFEAPDRARMRRFASRSTCFHVVKAFNHQNPSEIGKQTKNYGS